MSLVENKAKELGAVIDSGINWVWAIGFPSREAAQTFVDFLDANGYEHRGIYPDNDGVFSVRYR